MFRLFISLYLFLVVALVGSSALLEYVIFDDNASLKDTERLANALSQYDNIQQISEFAQRDGIVMQQTDISALALPESQHRLLNSQGYFISFSADGAQHIYLSLNDKLLHLSIAPTEPREKLYWYNISFFLILAGLIALWSYPLWRDIRKLEDATAKLRPDGSFPSLPIMASSPVHSIAQALTALSGQVKSLLNTQRELSSAVAHEFRTPLARMRFSLESVQDDNTRQSLQDDVLELEHLVQEMLEFSQSQHNKPEMSLAEIDIQEMCHSLQQRLPLHAKPISLHCDCHCQQLLADGHFVERAILNLLNNAVKYTKSQILLRCIDTKEGLQISIEDDGEGIAEENRERIFEPFFRPDPSRNRRQGGAGLGLAIVSQIMAWHKGKCWVESSDLGGAKFVLFFPAQGKQPN